MAGESVNGDWLGKLWGQVRREQTSVLKQSMHNVRNKFWSIFVFLICLICLFNVMFVFSFVSKYVRTGAHQYFTFMNISECEIRNFERAVVRAGPGLKMVNLSL